MEAVILVNQGGGGAGDGARAKVAAALTGAGIGGTVELVHGEDLEARAKQAVEVGAKLVIAGGGDGTISAVAGALAGSHTALGILPLGTLNHLARDLGLPTALDEAARVIASGSPRPIDAASLCGRLFVNNSAVGLYPLMVADREAQQAHLGRSKRLAMWIASLRTLIRYRHHRLSLTVNDGKTATIETPLLFVGNNEYQMTFPAPGQRESLTDGKLCVVAMKKQGRIALVTTLLRALAGRTRDADLIHLDDVTRLTVHSRRSKLTVSCDGETLELAPPLEYRILPGTLTVIA